MKKVWVITLAMILVMSLVFGACKKDENTEIAPTEDPGSEIVEHGDGWVNEPEYILVLSNHDIEQSLSGQYCIAWANMVKQKSKGRIEIQVNNGGAMAGPTESLDKVRGGSIDLAWGLQSLYPGRFPMSEALAIPCLPYKSSEHASKVAMDIWENTGLLDSDYDGVKVILLRANCDAPIATRESKLNAAADLNGMTIYSSGALSTSWLGALGASGQEGAVSDLAQNLMQGSLDGATTDWHSINAFRIYEVAQYFANEKVVFDTCFLLMNQDAYDWLPADLQAVIDECSGQAALDLMIDAWDDLSARAIEAYSVACEIYKLPNAESQILRDAATQITEAWLARSGASEKEIYDAILASIAKN